ncbi:uncharacterized protein LOC143728979 [Siphateles boraxobius]|uniref:uncharacterized protein LOC143728979 n=1 Tax=Siphateles boraxobius TaxID=180520 RepID=UPI0040643F7B
MEVPRLKKRPLRLCEHCDTELCHTQYFDPRKRHFKNGVWEKKSKRARSDESEMHPEHPEKEVMEESEEMHRATDSSDNDETADDQSIHLFLDSSDSESVQDEDISCYVDEYVTEEGEQSEAYPHIQDGKGHGIDQSRSEKTEDLLIKLLAMMLWSWQSTFKISDNAITSLLLCIKQFMWIMGNVLSANSLTAFESIIPKTLFSLRNWTGILRDNFLQLVSNSAPESYPSIDSK